jgi:hypothetical protein
MLGVVHLFLPGNIRLIYIGFVLFCFVCFLLIDGRLGSVMLARFGLG